MKADHENIYYLHKNALEKNASDTFHIELLNSDKGDVIETVIVHKKKKKSKSVTKKSKDKVLTDRRKRSWVWKYFDSLTNVIFQCTICKAVLSIKGFNSNNMNRHIRNRHPSVFNSEVSSKQQPMEIATEVEVTAETLKEGKTITVSELDSLILKDDASSKKSRSWIWDYFEKITTTLARCKFCLRVICHGGTATGNMNRHIKNLHNEVYQNRTCNKEEDLEDYSWIWKLFSADDDENFFSCRICNFKCLKFVDLAKSTSTIIDHLRSEHGVISGEQIITETTEVAIVDECSAAVDFLNNEELIV